MVITISHLYVLIVYHSARHAKALPQVVPAAILLLNQVTISPDIYTLMIVLQHVR